MKTKLRILKKWFKLYTYAIIYASILITANVFAFMYASNFSGVLHYWAVIVGSIVIFSTSMLFVYWMCLWLIDAKKLNKRFKKMRKNKVEILKDKK